MRPRRRDLAVLRSLGADRRWIGRTVHAQATALAVVALVSGLPAGIVSGRLLFRSLADRLGLVPDAATPLALVLLAVVTFMVVANLAAAVPARARRAPVASLLRVEERPDRWAHHQRPLTADPAATIAARPATSGRSPPATPAAEPAAPVAMRSATSARSAL